MTTTATANKELAPQAALDAATTATAAASAATAAAHQELADAEKRLADLEAALAAGDFKTKAEFTKVRRDIETARSDIEWSATAIAAATAVETRSYRDLEAARRRVTAEEYLAALREYNDPEARENQLLKQLTATIVELRPLLRQQRELHWRLDYDVENWPADEKSALNYRVNLESQDHRAEGRPFKPIPQRSSVNEIVRVADAQLAAAIKAAIPQQ